MNNLTLDCEPDKKPTQINDLKRKLELRKELSSLVDVTYYIPCLNEEANIIKTVKKICAVSKKMGLTFELLIYNDGSTDRSRALIEEFSIAHPEYLVTLINNRKRRGLGFNYTAGAFRGVGQYYIMICGDNSETEESMIKILERRDTADVVVPYFGDQDNRMFSRRILSRVFTFLVNRASGFRLRYYNGPSLHIRENVMRWHPTGSGFAYQAELLCILLEMKKTVVQVQIDNNDRDVGFSRAFHIRNILSVGHSLLQIFLRSVRRMIWPIDESFQD